MALNSDVHVGFGEVVERRLELGDLRALGALERVEVGPARAERPVGRDQRLHVHLLARHRQLAGAGLQREGVGLGALRERLDHRRVRHVAAQRAIGRRHVLQLVEVGAPVVGHAARVVEVGLVESPRRTGHCPRTGTSSTCICCIIFAHLSPRFPGCRWVINLPRPGLTGWRTSDPPCCWPARGTERTSSSSLTHCSTRPVELRADRGRCSVMLDSVPGARG